MTLPRTLTENRTELLREWNKLLHLVKLVDPGDGDVSLSDIADMARLIGKKANDLHRDLTKQRFGTLNYQARRICCAGKTFHSSDCEAVR